MGYVAAGIRITPNDQIFYDINSPNLNMTLEIKTWKFANIYIFEVMIPHLWWSLMEKYCPARIYIEPMQII